MAIHPDLAPMAFLLGRWEGAGIGGYPTIESFRFGQEIEIGNTLGKPADSIKTKCLFVDVRRSCPRRRGD